MEQELITLGAKVIAVAIAALLAIGIIGLVYGIITWFFRKD